MRSRSHAGQLLRGKFPGQRHFELKVTDEKASILFAMRLVKTVAPAIRSGARDPVHPGLLQQRLSEEVADYSAGAACVGCGCSEDSPSGRLSFIRKSQPMSSAPAEKTTSPGSRIHCQNRYWS